MNIRTSLNRAQKLLAQRQKAAAQAQTGGHTLDCLAHIAVCCDWTPEEINQHPGLQEYIDRPLSPEAAEYMARYDAWAKERGEDWPETQELELEDQPNEL